MDSIVSTTERALAYYRAMAREESPAFLPSRIRLAKRFKGDNLINGPFLVSEGDHDCRCTRDGEIVVTNEAQADVPVVLPLRLVEVLSLIPNTPDACSPDLTELVCIIPYLGRSHA